MPRVCIRVRANARGMLTLPAMRPCTQPRAPVLPINSRIARPGIRQLGVVTFRSVPSRPTRTTTTSTTATAFHRPSAFSTTSSHSPASGDAASSIWRSERTGRRGFPLRVSIHLVVRYWSTSDHEERPFSKRPRCASARAYWSSSGHGTGFASVAGAARTRRWHRDAENGKRETVRMRERERERERERGRMESPPAGLSAASAAELVISAVSAAVAVTTRQITQITTDYICTPSPTVVSFPGATTALPPYVLIIAQPELEYALDLLSREKPRRWCTKKPKCLR